MCSSISAIFMVHIHVYSSLLLHPSIIKEKYFYIILSVDLFLISVFTRVPNVYFHLLLFLVVVYSNGFIVETGLLNISRGNCYHIIKPNIFRGNCYAYNKTYRGEFKNFIIFGIFSSHLE